MTHYKALHGTDEKAKAIACLNYGVEYLEDVLRDYQELLESLEEYPERDVTAILTEKRAENSLHAALGYLERYNKGIRS